MSIVLRLVTGDVSELRQKSKLVDNPKSPVVQELVFAMAEIMHKNKGIGLAAPQVGQLLRIVIVSDGNQEIAMINPEILRKSKNTIKSEEGCLSLPGIYGEVERAEKVTVSCLNLDGKKVKIKASGLLARVIQHEVDHLEGILFVDKVIK